jgi:hypothetical protein
MKSIIMNPELWSNSDEDDKEANQPNYDEDKDQLEEEQEEETGEMTYQRRLCIVLTLDNAYY